MTQLPSLPLYSIKGLVTSPNEFGAYPEGACKVAQNILARSMGEWTQATDIEALAASAGASGSTIFRLVPLAPGRYLAILVDVSTLTTWTMNVDGSTSTPLTLPGFGISSTSLFFADGFLSPIVARDRLYLNGQYGTLVLDTIDPSSAAERALRRAGLPQPAFYGAGATFGAGQAIPQDVAVGYTAILRREYADGYVLSSIPSPVILLAETAGDVSWDITYTWSYNNPAQVGDKLELYRTAGISFTYPDYPDVGTSARLVASKLLTSSEVSVRQATLSDRQPMTSPLYETSGREIYTSPYQQGALSANLPPPIAKCACQWGEVQFWGNIVDDPVWTLDVPGGVFDTVYDDTPYNRENGIGTRKFTGNISSGSATISGISAADLVGVVPGQAWGGVAGYGWTFNSRIVSVGASSVTMDSQATGTLAGATCGSYDVIEINGIEQIIPGLYTLINALGSGSDWAVFATGPIHYNTVTQTGITVTIRPIVPGTVTEITLRATNGQNYSPALPEIDETVFTVPQNDRPNLLKWSRVNEPEHAPNAIGGSPNESYVGTGQITGIYPTTDAVFITCTDGLRRLSGTDGVYRIDIVDSSTIPVAPDAACVLYDTLYVDGLRGVVAVNGITTQPLSRGIIDEAFPGAPFYANRKRHLYANPTTEEIYAIEQGASESANSTVYVYSTLYRQWSTLVFSEMAITAMAMLTPSAGVNPYPIFGLYAPVTANLPAVYSWDGTGDPRDMLVDMQPLYGGDPQSIKQWVDMTWVLESEGDAQLCYPRFAGAGGYGYSALQLTPNDRRVTFGFARNYALAPTALIGLLVQNFYYGPATLKGVSVRYKSFTNQRRHR